MEEKLNGIVLGGVSYGDNDKILNIFTLEKGKVSARIKGVKKAGAKLKFAAEPFCFAEFVFLVSGDKRTVKTASLIESFYPVREDIVKFFCASTVLEFIKKFFRENITDSEMFVLVLNALKKIAYGNSPKKELLAFLISALKEVGYALKLDGCFACEKDIEVKPYFDYNVGGFFCENCFMGVGREINIKTYLALKAVSEEKDIFEEDATLGLRLIDYYISNKAEEKMVALEELIRQKL